jgi:hypothetical protein
MVSNNGTIGTNVAAASWGIASFGIGTIRMVRTHLKTIAQIGEKLDVAATYERLTGRRAAAQPLRFFLTPEWSDCSDVAFDDFGYFTVTSFLKMPVHS